MCASFAESVALACCFVSFQSKFPFLVTFYLKSTRNMGVVTVTAATLGQCGCIETTESLAECTCGTDAVLGCLAGSCAIGTLGAVAIEYHIKPHIKIAENRNAP